MITVGVWIAPDVVTVWSLSLSLSLSHSKLRSHGKIIFQSRIRIGFFPFSRRECFHFGPFYLSYPSLVLFQLYLYICRHSIHPSAQRAKKNNQIDSVLFNKSLNECTVKGGETGATCLITFRDVFRVLRLSPSNTFVHPLSSCADGLKRRWM